MTLQIQSDLFRSGVFAIGLVGFQLFPFTVIVISEVSLLGSDNRI